VVVEADRQLAQRLVQQTHQVGVLVAQPLLVCRERGTQRAVADHLGQQVVGGEAEPPRGEGGHLGTPLRETQGGVGQEAGHAEDESEPPPVGRLLARRETVELQDGLVDRLHHRCLGRDDAEPLAEPVTLLVEVTPHQVKLRRVVAEERTPRDSRGRGDVVDAGLVEPVLAEQLVGHPFQLRAGGHRRPTAPGFLSSGSARHGYHATCSILHPMPFTFCTQCHYTGDDLVPRGQEHVMADEPIVTTGPGDGPDEHGAGVLVDADLLVEEVSIDGMCGVY
jgi:mycofactocin precursor